MSDCADAARLGPAERLREAAAIRAEGVLRLHGRVALPAENAIENSAESAPTCLEVPDETVLSIHNR
jgi:hypothetical protein